MSTEGKTPIQASERVVWRSLEEKADPESIRGAACGSDVVKRTLDSGELLRLNRRKFLTLSGAMTTLAGVEGCVRRPIENILPYTDMPEQVNPGVPNHYASVINQGGEALGILATCYEGRPTKLEGNPDHPTSAGATDLWTQSAILDLYDPDRLRNVHKLGVENSFAEFDAFLAGNLSALRSKGGAGLHVLTQPSNSPTYLRVRQLVFEKLPQAHFAMYTPAAQSNVREGARLAFGQVATPIYDYSRAKVVLAVDSDFLSNEPGNVLAARQYGAGRDMESAAGDCNRMYAVEPVLSVTGSNADHRLRLSAQDCGRYLRALAAELATSQGIELGQVSAAVRGTPTDGIPELWLKAVAKDLAKNRGQSVIVVGMRQPPAVHALAFALNRALGNAGTTVTYTEAVDPLEPDNYASIKSLVSDMQSGKVETLLILGGNPVYDAPADLKFAEALKKVPTSVHFTSYMDETARLTTWQVPRAHELESWGDQQSSRGDYSVQQPMLAPLWGGRTDAEVMGVLADEKVWRSFELVRTTVEQRGIRGELSWRRLLHSGVATTRFGAVLGAIALRDSEVAAALKQTDAAPLGDKFEAVFMVDNKLGDGRYANNSWLLEMPDPITRITWDNAALFAPSTGKELGIKNGDMVRLTLGAASLDIVAWLQPGIAARSIGLPLGWGRTAAGRNGNGHGFDVYPMRSSAAPHFAAGVTVEKLGRKYKLSQTQEHDLMEGRPIAIEATLAEYKAQPNFAEYKSPDPEYAPLWERQDYSKGMQWGMVVDLNTCTGCSTCVIACQAENNVPVVGKDQVARGREMHWFRIDRYYVGENEDEPEVSFQPLGCQHCEEAPCENVCPVAATSHSPEGLNDIAYNRCIGTRYCMNNCPYKVRRFNFLNFNEDIPETRHMGMNPNVTVRFRGVIEKCSYCVQRIQMAKSKAKQQGRRELRDGEVLAACQQACPSRSISFGDLNDPGSTVAKKAKLDRNYALLADIGTHPRTRFLGKIRNPNPEMKA